MFIKNMDERQHEVKDRLFIIHLWLPAASRKKQSRQQQWCLYFQGLWQYGVVHPSHRNSACASDRSGRVPTHALTAGPLVFVNGAPVDFAGSGY